MQLLNLFRELTRPNVELGESTFQVAQIRGYPAHRLGKDGSGAPALLVRVRDDDAAQAVAPIALQHVTVQHRVRCRLLSGEVSSEESFTVVRCVSGERALREYFIRIVEATVEDLGPSPTRGQVTRAMRRLTELFRAFELPSRKTAQGLWAELVVIALSSQPEALIRAWHSDPDEGYDFADGSSRVEVKSFSQPARVHSFSLRQARPGAGVDVVIASLRAERSAGGSNISDVIAMIERRVTSSDARLKVEEVVARSLGDVAATALTLAFDFERARASLCFFDSRSVPSIELPLPQGVLAVRLDALLNDSQALTLSSLASRNVFFAAAAPT